VTDDDTALNIIDDQCFVSLIIVFINVIKQHFYRAAWNADAV